MMVGPLTLFNDEDQFPRIHSEENINGFEGLKNLKSDFVKNLNSVSYTHLTLPTSDLV